MKVGCANNMTDPQAIRTDKTDVIVMDRKFLQIAYNKRNTGAIDAIVEVSPTGSRLNVSKSSLNKIIII